MVSLLDVNLLVALFDADHIHHELSHDWFADHHADGCDEGGRAPCYVRPDDPAGGGTRGNPRQARRHLSRGY